VAEVRVRMKLPIVREQREVVMEWWEVEW